MVFLYLEKGRSKKLSNSLSFRLDLDGGPSNNYLPSVVLSYSDKSRGNIRVKNRSSRLINDSF